MIWEPTVPAPLLSSTPHNLVGRVSRNGSVLAKYSYLADGTKLGSERADGSGSVYRGSLIYALIYAKAPGGRH
ncbi:MAG: hypothetical protein ACOX5T_07340 [Candidatus Cryptobacteroides sp.]